MLNKNRACHEMERAAPSLNKEEQKRLNDLFPAYLFRRRKTKEIWCTSCGEHGVLTPGATVLSAEHTKAPGRKRYYCHHGVWSAMPEPAPPEPAACPFCGKVLPVKELGRTGKRENLAAFRRAAVLRWYRGALWVRCYNVTKTYGEESDLTAGPKCTLLSVYRFVPGKVTRAYKYGYWCQEWAGWKEYNTKTLRLGSKLPEPFGYCCEEGMGYATIGLEEVEKSPFRWCGVEAFLKRYPSHLIGCLGICTAYPRQMEMLIKSGMVEVVADLAFREKPNKRSFDWRETDPLKAFGLNKTEMRSFLEGGCDLEVLAGYKSLCRGKVSASLPELYELKRWLGSAWFRRVTARMRRYGVGILKVHNYIEKAQQEVKKTSIQTAAGWWCDYLDAAETLGYDLNNPVFLFPKALKEHHDQATKAAMPILEARRDADTAEKARQRCRVLAKRYTYSDGRYLIRPPVGVFEIVAEGKALHHCVGKYADDHVKGKTTILFLRDREKPGESLVTIEIRGSQIIQIHGWDDERTKCKANPKKIPPKELYAQILEPWLAWVKAGSKRDKRGRPKLPDPNKKKEAQVA